MAKSLVIVESPAKARTIKKYLGRGYTVKASLGHVKDLPRKKLGVNVDKNFQPTYFVIPGKEKVVIELREAARKVDSIYLAADPDREGEAICAHLKEVLTDKELPIEPAPANKRGKKKKTAKGKKTKKGAAKKKVEAKKIEKPPVLNAGPPIDKRKKIFRVSMNEITKRGVQQAFEKPTQIDTHLVNAQQARRVLDRLVGYEVSPLLWDKVKRGLSAGRVQTVALRLVVEREQEVRAFKTEEYWTLDANLSAASPPAFDARLVEHQGKKLSIPNQEASDGHLAALRGVSLRVAAVQKKERRRNPVPPFTTSKLQQDAARKLRFSVKRTMMLAQRLYEGIELGEEGSIGLITYMRTDSTRVSQDALDEVRQLIPERYGPKYLPEKPRVFKSKKGAQDAHEAVRPTSVSRAPADVKRYLKEDELKVYTLIWQRFIASQMAEALFDQTTIDIAAGDYRLRAESCWSLLVVKGGTGLRRRSFFCTAATRKLTPRSAARCRSDASWLGMESFLPWCSTSRASKAGGEAADRLASMVQYSSVLKARTSCSRSTTSRSATVCTRPAESPRLTLSQSSGLTS